MSSEEEEESEDEEYPPWLAVVLDEHADYWDDVVVLQSASDGGADKEWIEVKAIEAPDTTDAAAGKGPGQCRTYTVQRYSTILITSEPLVPPYIGLVDKVFRRRNAQEVKRVNGKPVYRLTDFGVHCYWFYRPMEVPDTAWSKRKSMRKHTEGSAQYRFPGKGKQLSTEDFSEREVLFSSHHTLHDYPDDKGILSLDGFLQACQVHWLGPNLELTPRLEVHGSTLVQVRPPGFVVRGFLWCNSKHQPQLAADSKEVHRLNGSWPDQDTQDIVHLMCERYEGDMRRMAKRNQDLVGRFYAARSAGQQTIPSDDGEDTPTGSAGGPRAPQRQGAAAAKAVATSVPSPQLDGVAGEEAAAPLPIGHDEGGLGMLLDGDDDD